MKKILVPSGFEKSLQNLESGFGSLKDFLAEPARTPAVVAGIVQAFEYTFELFWKSFQKVGDTNGNSSGSPRSAVLTANQMGLILEPDFWLKMLKDRNLSSHSYNRQLADEIVSRVEQEYVDEFEAALSMLKAL